MKGNKTDISLSALTDTSLSQESPTIAAYITFKYISRNLTKLQKLWDKTTHNYK